MKIFRMLVVGGAVGAASYWLNRYSVKRRSAEQSTEKEAQNARWEDEGGTPAATPLDTPDPSHVARPSAGA